MKVLFLTVSAGEGHNSICRSLTSQFEKYPDVQAKTVDLFKGRNKLRTYLVNKGYFTICRYAIHFANAVFELTRRTDYRNKKITASSFFVNNAINFVKETIEEYKPDAVFCAHTFAGICMSKLREQKNEIALSAKVFSIVSDFDVAPTTECLTKIDYIFAPTPDFDGDLVKKGFSENQIVTTGIPINEKFCKKIDKSEARHNLGIDKNMFTLLIMNGGFGFGNNAKLVKNLRKSKNNFQILTINGKNKKQLFKLNKFKNKTNDVGLTNFGFVNNVDEIMSASDIIITKLGGLTTSEAFSKGLPIIATKKLPFQEVENKDYLVSKNACIYLKNNNLAYKVVDSLIASPDRLAEMQKSVSALSYPTSSKTICDFIVNSVK